MLSRSLSTLSTTWIGRASDRLSTTTRPCSIPVHFRSALTDVRNLRRFANVAISTFHLDDRTGFVNQRTIVLKKTNAGWKIVHLHASEVPVTNTQR